MVDWFRILSNIWSFIIYLFIYVFPNLYTFFSHLMRETVSLINGFIGKKRGANVKYLRIE